MSEDIVVPVALFSMFVAIIWLVYFYGHKKRNIAHKTIRLALDKGQELSPEMIARMSDMVDPKLRDLRKGIILLSLTLGLIVMAFILPIDDRAGIRGMLGGAVLPGMIGLAYLGLWRFGHDRNPV